MSKVIFVYGTLKYGHCNHGVLGNEARLICKDTVLGFQMHSLGGYPALSPSKGKGIAVQGEVWEIPNEQLSHVDRLEGYREEDEDHGFYDRATIRTEGGLIAIMYYMHECHSPLVESGVW